MNENVYYILKCDSLENISTEVHKMLPRGWKPHGAPFAIPVRARYASTIIYQIKNHYGQAMTRIEDRPELPAGASELVRRIQNAQE